MSELERINMVLAVSEVNRDLWSLFHETCIKKHIAIWDALEQAMCLWIKSVEKEKGKYSFDIEFMEKFERLKREHTYLNKKFAVELEGLRRENEALRMDLMNVRALISQLKGKTVESREVERVKRVVSINESVASITGYKGDFQCIDGFTLPEWAANNPWKEVLIQKSRV